MTYAKTEDVAELAGKQLTEEELVMCQRRLDQVERMIRRRVPDLDEQITAGSIALEEVVDVESEAVWRVLRNPEGYQMEMDGSYQMQRHSSSADSSLRITSQEWAVLGVRVGSMFTIAPNVVMPQ